MELPKVKLTKDHLIKIGVLTLSIIISIIVFIFRKNLTNLSSYGYLGIFLINLIGSSTVIIPVPSFLASIIGGSIYNPILVGIFSGVGSGIGELTGYLAGYGSTATVKESKNFLRMGKWMKINGFLTIFILSFIPNPLFDMAGIFAGVTTYSIKKFLIAVILGKSLRFTILAYLGSYSINNFIPW